MAASSGTQKAERVLPMLSRDSIEVLIAQGRHIFILDGNVIKADPWLQYHPGGPKAIEHMVGRDATDEVKACVLNCTISGNNN
jgi:sphingolipid 8-(E)-desaturase